MASKLSDFLKENGIDIRRVLIASRKLEKLRPEDRALRLKQRQGGDKEKPAAAEGEEGAAPPAKRRSGRPVTKQLIDRIEAGKAVSGAAKTRVLRAVNHVLEQKKKSTVELKALF